MSILQLWSVSGLELLKFSGFIFVIGHTGNVDN